MHFALDIFIIIDKFTSRETVFVWMCVGSMCKMTQKYISTKVARSRIASRDTVGIGTVDVVFRYRPTSEVINFRHSLPPKLVPPYKAKLWILRIGAVLLPNPYLGARC